MIVKDFCKHGIKGVLVWRGFASLSIFKGRLKRDELYYHDVFGIVCEYEIPSMY